MAVHKWRKRPTKYFGEVWVPYAQIEVQRPDGGFQAVALQVDSGAVISLLRRSVADLIGIELQSGRRVELGSVGDATVPAYVHDVVTRFADNITCTIPFAFATVESVRNPHLNEVATWPGSRA